MKKHTSIKAAAAGILFSALLVAVSAGSAQAYHGGPNILVGRDMTVGATGPDVTELQGLLSELGFLQVPAGIPLGYFGSMTRTAVASYQRSLGVIDTGYFGPLTKQAMTASFGAKNWLKLLYPGTY